MVPARLAGSPLLGALVCAKVLVTVKATAPDSVAFPSSLGPPQPAARQRTAARRAALPEGLRIFDLTTHARGRVPISVQLISLCQRTTGASSAASLAHCSISPRGR